MGDGLFLGGFCSLMTGPERGNVLSWLVLTLEEVVTVGQNA
jgi:hypothetical protein